MDRLGRGYSFEALRAKILFAEGIHEHKLSRPKFERRRAEMEYAGIADPGIHLYGLPPAAEKPPRPRRAPQRRLPTEKNYGADINTLIELLGFVQVSTYNRLTFVSGSDNGRGRRRALVVVRAHYHHTRADNTAPA